MQPTRMQNRGNLARAATSGGEPYYRMYGNYAGQAPAFEDRRDCPWLDDIEAAWPEIRAEVDELLRADDALLRPVYVPDGVEIQGWRSLNFMTYLRRYDATARRLPRTARALARIPHLTSAFLNLLEPGARLPMHCGDTDATIRSHLGVIVPGELPQCGIEVGGERRGWREGQAFSFNEAHPHWVWNDTDAPRVVLVFDVMRPAFAARQREICAMVLAQIVQRVCEVKLPWLVRRREVTRRQLQRLLARPFDYILARQDRGLVRRLLQALERRR